MARWTPALMTSLILMCAIFVKCQIFLLPRRQEQQQKEHEDDMRARLRRSESIEKAAVSSFPALIILLYHITVF